MSLNLTFVFEENVLVSDACNQRALRNEIIILKVLEAQEPAVFRWQKLFNTLTHYYEEIQSMSSAGGRQKPKHFTRTMLDELVAGGGESREAAPAAAAEDAAGNWQRAAAAADAEAPTIPATHPAKQQKRNPRAAGSGGAKPE
jgi:hypothetical protein